MLQKPSKSQAFWHQSFAKKWGEISKPPICPSKSEVAIIRSWIKKHKGQNLLVLGSTPQYRDLGHELKKQVAIADISLKMMQAMSEFMKYKNKVSEELWLKANWLEMPVRQNHWDFVLGDLVLANMPLKLWPKFLQKINKVLKPNGFFITRCWWKEKFSSDSFLETIINNPNLEKKWNSSEVVWLAHMLPYNPTAHTISSKKGRTQLKNLIKKEKDKPLQARLKKILNMYNEEIPGNKTWWGFPKKNLDKIFSRYFHIIDIQHGNDHCFTQDTPVYLLKKK